MALVRRGHSVVQHLAAVLVMVVVVAVVAVSCATTRWHQLDGYTFERYEREFHKHYESRAERQWRSEVFYARLHEIRSHNAEAHHSWKKGVNAFTDRTDAERRGLRGYHKPTGFSRRHVMLEHYHEPDASLSVAPEALPTSVDWRDKGVVSAVKDQGQCGSCWSFASAETLESMWALQTGELPVLSEQQILACTPNDNDCGGTGGCGGGTAELAYGTLLANNGGLTSEWVYPYISYRGSNFRCEYSISNTPNAAWLAGVVRLPSNQYTPVLNALANVGPSAIAVDATAWHDYESGVFTGCNATNPDLDHVVQLVGYGTDAKYGDYWTVRNSWAPTWGENGYIRLPRSSTPSCGVDLSPQDGSGCNGGPPNVTVCGACGLLYDVVYPIVLPSAAASKY